MWLTFQERWPFFEKPHIPPSPLIFFFKNILESKNKAYKYYLEITLFQYCFKIPLKKYCLKITYIYRKKTS